MTNINVAVVGCGYWGKNLIRNFHQLNTLHTICDLIPEALQNFQQQYPGMNITSDYQALLNEPDIHAIVLATPAETHFDLTQQALEAGKDVFVEKPLALRYEEGERLVALAAQKQQILMVGHLLEYHPAITELRHLIESGELGKLYYLYSNRLNLGKVRREENILWSFAPHDIAVLLRLVGTMPVEVSARGSTYLQPDIADVTTTHLGFPDNVQAHVFVSWLHPYKEQRLVVIGERKMVVFNDVVQQGKLKIYDKHLEDTGHEFLPRHVAETTVYLPEAEPLKLECQHFLKCIQTRSQPLTDGASGLRVLKILDLAQQSLTQNGTTFSLAPENML